MQEWQREAIDDLSLRLPELGREAETWFARHPDASRAAFKAHLEFQNRRERESVRRLHELIERRTHYASTLPHRPTHIPETDAPEDPPDQEVMNGANQFLADTTYSLLLDELQAVLDRVGYPDSDQTTMASVAHFVEERGLPALIAAMREGESWFFAADELEELVVAELFDGGTGG